MFKVNGRQFKALAELAKVTGKNNGSNYLLACSPIIAGGHFILTNSYVLVDITCDGLGCVRDSVYGNAFVAAKPKVKDTVEFDTDSFSVTDGQTRKTTDLTSSLAIPDACRALAQDGGKAALSLFERSAAPRTSGTAFSPELMSFVSGLFSAFKAPVEMSVVGETRLPMLMFESYAEGHTGCGAQLPGFHMRVALAGMRKL